MKPKVDAIHCLSFAPLTIVNCVLPLVDHEFW